MMGGDWMVALYENGEMNETENYMDYTFNFMANHLISTTLSEMGVSYPGLWRVLRNSDGKIKVYLNFGDVNPLAELTDDWEWVSNMDGSIKLKHVSVSNDGLTEIVNTLVFVKKTP